jgi:DNA-directed RNA polymerase specialized sigma24 family protein
LYLEGFTLPEIKQQLSISRRTVTRGLTECRLALKKAFTIEHTKLRGQK